MYLIVLTIAFIKHITLSSYQTKKLIVLSDVVLENCLVSFTTEADEETEENTLYG